MGLLTDIDVYSRLDKEKKLTQHLQDDAISNAMIFFLSTVQGDFLFEPQRGGILKKLLFKVINEERIFETTKEIKNELESEFGKYAKNIEVFIDHYSDTRLTEIQIYWNSIITNEENQVLFYSRNYKDSQIKKTEIPFIDDNLLTFVIMKKPENENKKLIKNLLTNYYEWGNYIFINFNESSSNFNEIENICNE